MFNDEAGVYKSGSLKFYAVFWNIPAISRQDEGVGERAPEMGFVWNLEPESVSRVHLPKMYLTVWVVNYVYMGYQWFTDR